MSCTATAELPESKLGVSSAVVRRGTEKSQGCIRSDRRGEISLIRICDGRFLIQRLEGSRPSVGWSDRSLEGVRILRVERGAYRRVFSW
jgi:hypothetical protein